MRRQSTPRKMLLAGTALQAVVLVALALPAAADPAPNARPTGGVVTAGAATISTTPTTTTITQASQRAAIQWRGFDVGAAQSVRFAQPSSSAVALNRVVGPNPSQIAGRIDANGQVILINQDGVLFYKGAQVNTAGLVVSAAGMSDRNFMAGRMVFDQPAHPGARIGNAGTVTVGQAGLAAFVAPQVANSGVINARLGHVVLAGAATATLDLYGDGLVALDVTNQVTQTPGGATALVTNTGTILAAGGTVQLTASAADGVIETLIDAGGTIAAASLGGRTGTIVLNGIGGGIAVSGALLAQGLAPGTHGGQIEVLPSGTASLAPTAVLDASGAAGGGTIALGTTLARAAGGPAVAGAAMAQSVVVAQGAGIAASATGTGNGGRITLLSSDSTVMAGSVVARGGPAGGDGGSVEVSGGSLGYTGTLDVGAPLGAAGSVLFDPDTLTIVAGNSGDGSADKHLVNTGGTILQGFDAGGTDTVSDGALELITTGTIVLQAKTLLEVQSGLTFNAGVTAVTLDSGGNVVVDPGQSLVLPAAGSVLSLQAGPAGTITLTGATLNAASVTLASGSGGVVLGTASIDAGGLVTVTATGGGAITQTSGGVLNVGTLTADTTGAVLLGSALNAIGTIAGMTAGPTAEIANATSLLVDGPIAATAVTLTTATGDLTLAADVNGPGAVTLAATGGSIGQPSGGVATARLSASAGGALGLGSPQNAIGTVVRAVAGAGDLLLVNGGDLTVAGQASGWNATLEVASNGGTLALGSVALAANVSATAAGGGVTLVADRVLATLLDAITTTATGTVTVSPYSAGPVSLGGTLTTQLELGTLLLNDIRTGTLVVGGSKAAAISIDGPVNLNGLAGTLDLLSAGAITQAAGPLTVGALSATANGIALATVQNAIGTLDAISAGQSLQVANASSLTVAGPITATSVALSTGTGDLALAGEVSASSVTLTAMGGSITQSSGGISTGTLSADASGSLDLMSPGNAIGTVDAASADTALQITNAGSLTIAGPLAAGPAGSGTVLLATIAGDLILAGNVTASAGVTLVADNGSIRQTGGALATPLLAASASASLNLGSPDNAIGTLDSVSAGLSPGRSLLVADGGALTVDGPVGADAVTLSAATGDLTLAGTIAATTSLSLTAATGSVVQSSGAVSAGTLSGGAGVAFDLGASGNLIGTLGSVSAGVSVLVADGSALAVAGPVSASAITLSTATGDLTLAGNVSSGDVSLTATGGSIVQSGSAITAGSLSASAGGSIDLGSTLNAIATVARATAGSGDLRIVDGGNLTLAGTLGGQNVTLEVATAGDTLAVGSDTVAATVTATAAGGGVTLLADRMSATGASTIAAGGSVTLAPYSAIAVSLAGQPGTALGLGNRLLGDIGTGTLVIGGATATAISVDGAAGAPGAGTLDLRTTGAITEAAGTGSLTAATLTAAAGAGIALGSAGNAVGTAIDVAAGNGDLLLVNGGNLSLAGTLAGRNATIEVAAAGGALALGSGAVPATVTATDAGGSVTLLADRISEVLGSSVASAGTLTIAPYSDIPVSLAGTAAAGLLLDPMLLGEISTGTLVVGSLATATAISVDGSATLTGHAATLDLLTAGSIVEPGGTLSVGVLTATAGGSIVLGATANAIGTLEAVSASAVTLADGGFLDVLGRIAAGTQLSLSAGGGIGLAGGAPVTAPSIALDGGTGGITLTGAGILGSSTTTLDLAGGGGVTEAATAVIRAALLTSASGIAGNVALLGTGNAIGGLGPFAATAGTLTLADGGAGVLAVGGPVTAQGIALGTQGGEPATIDVAGRVIATRGLALAAGAIAVQAAGSLDGAVIALASAGPITLAAGAGIGDALATLSLSSVGAGVAQDPGSRIVAATLESRGGIAGAADLAGTANAIATLQDLSSGSFFLADGGAASLTIAGRVQAARAILIGGAAPPADIALVGAVVGQAVTLAAGSGGIQITGTLNAAQTAELDTAGGGIRQSGQFVAATLQSAGVTGPVAFAGTDIATLGAFAVTGGGFALDNAGAIALAGPVSAQSIAIASGGGMVVAGTLAAAGSLALTTTPPGDGIVLGAASAALLSADTVALSADGPIGEPNGVIVANTLVVAGHASASLGNPGNRVATLGPVTVSGGPGANPLLDGGDFLLADAAPLLVGQVVAANVTLATPAALTLAGSIHATGQVALSAGGGITEAGGPISAGTLTVASVGTVTLGNPGNDIAVLGAAGAGGDLVLADAAAPTLTVNGPVTAANIAIGTPATLVIAGAITTPGQLSLAAGAGGIVERGGAIAAATLTGGSAGAADLGGANAIGQIAGFTAGTAFSLADTTALTLAGTLAAPLISVQMPDSVFTLGNGAAIVTGGTPEPSDFVLLDASAGGAQVIAAEIPTAGRPALSAGQPVGAYLTVGGFAQLGTSQVAAPAAGGASILRIDAGGAGAIGFANLQGPGTWLLIDVGTGKVSGNIFVRSLTLQYPAAGAAAALAGTIDDITGPAAAGAAIILPLPSSKFSLNHCPLHSINCVLLPLESLPAQNPLENFSIGTLLNSNDDDSLLLPIVSNRDY